MDNLRIPVCDLRAADILGYPRDKYEGGMFSDVTRHFHRREAEVLTEDPHTYCDHARGLCVKEGYKP